MLGQFSRWYLLKQKYDNRKCKAIKGGKSEEVQNMEEKSETVMDAHTVTASES